MRLEINKGKLNGYFYDKVCKLIYKSVIEDLKKNINKRKYSVREEAVLESGIIKWKGAVPAHIDLVNYITNCLELVFEGNIYVIRLNDRQVVRGSTTKVSTLIRLLEYGNEKITPYPYITCLLKKYEKAYEQIADEFLRRNNK